MAEAFFTEDPNPMVSVIIPCFNHGNYLSKAIESVRAQTYKHHEIIVVDDGSADNTKSVASGYPEVSYVYQQNQGLAAARNTGINHSKGSLLVFLDSDDWLIPEALEVNVGYILEQPELAFVSGAYMLFYELENKVRKVIQVVKDDNYVHMLKGNYIGMIATVMFRKWIFDSLKYDTSLKVCEDYDLYLQIVRNYPAIQHDKMIAVYRMHDKNLSGNHIRMLETAIALLDKQKDFVSDDREIEALLTGQASWKFYYSAQMYEDLLHQLFNGKKMNGKYIKALLRNNKKLYLKFMQKRSFHKTKRQLKKMIPDFILRKLGKSTAPTPGKVNMGDLNVTEPFSTEFAYDRGGPVDRYYIENFLRENESVIRGRALEIGDNEYTLRYGGSRVTQSDILYIDETNPYATIIGDLSHAPHIPSDCFDCIILTQTLHLIYNFKGAIETCFRILKPGGTLLLTVPGISHVDQSQWGKYWLWSFTDNSISRILSEYFSPEKTRIETFGNVLIATAFLYGMGLPEVTKEQLNTLDPNYQVIIAASAIK
jgi:glycosyltransferase involved in cell wall biosynthesis